MQIPIGKESAIVLATTVAVCTKKLVLPEVVGVLNAVAEEGTPTGLAVLDAVTLTFGAACAAVLFGAGLPNRLPFCAIWLLIVVCKLPTEKQ